MKIKNSQDPVIILDDDIDDLMIIEKAYKASGLENPVKKFLSPEALNQYLDAVKKGEKEMPSMLVIDVNLGTTNGFDFVKEIRADSAFSKEPTIMMISGESNSEYRNKTKNSGANAYVIKSFDRKEYGSVFNSIFWV